jgi:hypothetical protein
MSMPTELRTPRGHHLAAGAVEGVHAHHAADAQPLVQRDLVLGLHIEGLAQRDVEPAVGADAAGACAVVEALLLRRDEFALLHHRDHRHLRAFVKELGGREVEHPVVLHHDQETVLGPAHAVGVGELQARREGPDLVGHAVAVAVGDGPHRGLSGADEEHVGAGRHRHVAGVRHHGEEFDAEARRQLDALEVLAQGVGVAALLGHRRQVQVGGGDLELLELVDVGLRDCLRGRRLVRPSHFEFTGNGRAVPAARSCTHRDPG